MMAATAQESMYLDFMDCPPTMMAAGKRVFPRARQVSQQCAAAKEKSGTPSMGEPDDGWVTQKFQGVE